MHATSPRRSRTGWRGPGWTGDGAGCGRWRCRSSCRRSAGSCSGRRVLSRAPQSTHTLLNYTAFQENVHLFTFSNNSVKNEPIVIIYGMLNPEKIWHENFTDLSISTARCSQFTFTLGNQKSHFRQYYCHVYSLCAPGHHCWKMTKVHNNHVLKHVATLPCNLSLIACFLTWMFHKVVWQHMQGVVGFVITILLQIYLRISKWKSYENRLRFDSDTGNESVPKTIINNTINLFFKPQSAVC